MVYYMDVWVDGGCRGNGLPNAIGAAAAIFYNPWTEYIQEEYTVRIPYHPNPTSARAEIQAVILALEKTLELSQNIPNNSSLNVEIHSDSQYTVDCMSDWIYEWKENEWKENEWKENEWRNWNGLVVANCDLLQRASYLDSQVQELGYVEYIWVPREDNEDADELVNDELDGMADELYGYYV